MALNRLTKVDGGGISTTSDYRVGIITATKFVGPFDGTGGNFTGVITATDGNFSGNVTIGGTLTYEDVTNIDSVGVITARDGIDCNGDLDVDGHTNLDNISVAGVSTCSGDLYVAENIIHTGDTDTKIKFANVGDIIQLQSGGTVKFQTNTIGARIDSTLILYGVAGNPGRLRLQEGGALSEIRGVRNTDSNSLLYFDTEIAGTTSTRVVIDESGHFRPFTDSTYDLGINGTRWRRVFADTYFGNGNLGILTATNIDLNGDLDVDGHTNLDNVSIAGVTTTSDTIFIKADNKYLSIGAHNDGDMLLYHDGNKSVLVNYTGDFHIRTNNGSRSSLEGIILKPNGATELYHSGNLRLETRTNDVKIHGGLVAIDNVKIQLGSSGDLQLFHDGQNSYISDPIGIGNLRIRVNTGQVELQPKIGEYGLICKPAGAVELYHNNEAKILTESNGATVQDLTATGAYLSITSSSGNNGKVYGVSGTTIGFLDNQNHWLIKGIKDGSVELFHDNNKKFQTQASGAKIFNTAGSGGTRLEIQGQEGEAAILQLNADDGDDNADYSRIYHGTDGAVLFQNYTSGNWETNIKTIGNGAVELYHDNSPILSTTATGIEVTGEVAASQDYPNFQPTIDFNFASEKKLDSRITYSRTGPASFTDEFGKVVLVGDNVPRFDHDPDTRESKGLLIEATRTNLWLYSEDLVTYVTGGELQQSTLANTTATTDPTGGTNAVKMAATATSGSHSFYKNLTSGSNGNTHTASVWVKAAGVDYARIYVDTVGGNMGGPGVTFSTGNTWNMSASGTGTQVATSVVKYPNGWWRLSVSGSFSNQNAYYVHVDIEGGEGDVSYTGNGSNGIYVWGVQFESGPFPTSYIPTNGSTATRGLDLPTVEGTDFSNAFGTEFKEFSLVADYDNTTTFDGNSYGIIDLWGESTGYDHRIEWFKDDASPYHIETRAFGGGNALFNNGNLSASSKAKSQRFAASWYVPDYSNTSSRRFVVSMGGEAVDVIADNTGSTVPQITRMGIGCNPTRFDFSGGVLHFKRLMVYNKTLSDGQLQNLSAQ